MKKYETIKLERDAYFLPVPFTEYLERLDPSDEYHGTPEEELDAFERQLKRFEIKVSGSKSDNVEKFFKSEESAVLFPEFVRRSVEHGIRESDGISSIVATKTIVNGLEYRPIEFSLPKVDDYIPECVGRTKENIIRLKKRGRMLVCSYEALRFQRLDVFQTVLRQIGAYISRQKFADAIETLLNGDGNNNSAVEISVGPSTFGPLDIYKAAAALEPFNLDTLILPNSYIWMNDFPNDCKIMNYHGLEPNQAIILDSKSALEYMSTGGVEVDAEKLIEKDFENVGIFETFGFAKIFQGASKILKIY